MKKVKKFIGFALLPTVALLVAGYALHGKKADTLSDLAKENIRALSNPKPISDCAGGSCSYTDSWGNKCDACCPEGKNPYCNRSGCGCKVEGDVF